MQNEKKFDNRYVVIKNIYKGGFYKIYSCYDNVNKEICVLKVLKKMNSPFNKFNLEKQIVYFKNLKVDHLVELKEYNMRGFKERVMNIKPKPCSYLVFEFAQMGDLFDYVKINKGLYLNVAIYYFKQLIDGLENLHNLNICHRDIKLENLILNEKFKLLISDFEFCEKILNKENAFINHTEILGTPQYMAPEFYSKREISGEYKVYYNGDKVDIFASGVLLYIMVIGRIPFKTAESTDHSYRMFVNANSIFWKDEKFKNVKHNLSDNFKDLINRIFEPDPDKRISLKDIKNHPFLKISQIDDELVYNYMYNISLMINMKRKNLMNNF
jgi:serine/threonine protein kinase